MKNFIKYILLICLICNFISCRSGNEIGNQIVSSTGTEVTLPVLNSEIKGFFLLNEGNMGSNKSTLDYFDYETGRYIKNIYGERNPGVVKELGDVGNDIQIYGDKLYAVINCSHLIEVMNVTTAKHLGVISIPNCRYIVFHEGYGYVSSFAGPVQMDPNARLGIVAKIDTATMKVVAECTVGYQPEEMVIIDNKLYIANSGGYRAPNYDTRLSVIDLATFTEIEKIEIAPNIHRLEKDNNGNIFISSRGDHYGQPSKTFVFNINTGQVTELSDGLPCTNMTTDGRDFLFAHSSDFSYNTNSNVISYAKLDLRNQKIVSRNFITDGTEKSIVQPYGLAVNPETGEILVTDAKNYIMPGMIHCYDNNGRKKWSATTGDIPAHIVFTKRRLTGL